MTELQAAIGLIQLKKLDQMNSQRRHNAALYRSKLNGLSIRFQADVPGHVYHYLTATLPRWCSNYRSKFLAAVRAEGAMINCLYPVTLSRTKLFAASPNKPEISGKVSSSLFNLYVNPDVDSRFIETCCMAIRKVLGNYT